MMLDIQALQHLYGADFGTNAGSTVYKWNRGDGKFFINGASQGGHTNDKVFMTIWDGGGTDTYDLSNYNNATKIDLRAGHWTITSKAQLADLDFSDGAGVHMARGNVANALLFNGDLRSLIENAKGGSSIDTIYGNQVRNTLYGNNGNDYLRGYENSDKLLGGNGNDSLEGGQGSDSLTGNAGKDLFIFRAVTESRATTTTSDLIRDFSHSQGDDIHLKYMDAIGGGRDNAFKFIGKTSSFTDDGQVRYTWASNGNTYVWLNTDSDNAAEGLIRLSGHKTLFASDFIL
jgi:serralysin